MNSTSTSSSTLVELSNLNLEFNTHFLRHWNWRDVFIEFLHHPTSMFTSESVVPVLRDVSLRIGNGDRVGIVGSNGAGKTSLCRCIAGMLHPSAGAIHTSGRVRAIFDANIGLYPELSGRENVELLALMTYPELTVDERRDVVADSLEFSELAEFVDAPFRTYSKGMQARLALSLLSARPCDVLILDEMFDGADRAFREKISARVLRLVHSSGAVLFVSHSDEHIRAACNRVIVLHDHSIAFDGPVEEGLLFYRKQVGG